MRCLVLAVGLMTVLSVLTGCSGQSVSEAAENNREETGIETETAMGNGTEPGAVSETETGTEAVNEQTYVQEMEAIQDMSERILMINDKLYYGSDETGPMGDAGCVEGKIASTVEAGTIPVENGQSNFGCIGNPYTYDFDNAGNIQVLMEDEEYHFFYTQEEAGK